MRTYSTLTKKQLVAWLDNFKDDTLIAAFDNKGNLAGRIELSEGIQFSDFSAMQCKTVLTIKGREK